MDLFLYNYFFPFAHNNVDIFNIFQFSIWAILSYILGKYSFTDIKIIDIFKRQFFCLIFLILITSLVKLGIHLVIKNSNSFEIYDLSNLIFLSFILNTLFNIFLNPSKELNKKWIFVGSQDRFYILQENLKLCNENLKICLFNKSHLYSSDDNYSLLLDSDSKDFQSLKYINGLSNIKTIKLDYWFRKILKRYPPDLISDNLLIKIKKNGIINNAEYKLKSFIEKFIAIILLFLLSPVILITLILVFLEDRHNPLFYQKRTGLNNKIIKITKIRTMKYDVSKNNLNWAKNNDSRITRIGSLIRKVRIDELPQLCSVISGDISLIGPRPERPEIDVMLAKKIKDYKVRYDIKPGLSGWAQVNYPYGASVKDSCNKLSYDFFYIKNYSLILDLIIFFKTIRLVLNGRGSMPFS